MHKFPIRNAVLALALVLALTSPAVAQSERAYDKQLFRLSEIMGAVHYLRELCGADDGQRWRTSVSDIINAEGTTALRRATLAQRFNRGYRGYRRTYRNCTPSARSTIDRFIKEAIEISETLIKLGQ